MKDLKEITFLNFISKKEKRKILVSSSKIPLKKPPKILTFF